jgi:hypothetical protein
VMSTIFHYHAIKASYYRLSVVHLVQSELDFIACVLTIVRYRPLEGNEFR